MPRRATGPRLVWLEKRRGYYVRWTEDGRTREKSCATADQCEAEKFFAGWLATRAQNREGTTGPRDPAAYSVIEALEIYAREHATHIAAPERIGYALDVLTEFWGNTMVADITDRTCRAYDAQRQRAPATIRRELGILRAALRYAERHGRLTRALHVFLPPKPPGKDRWLTRGEAAALLSAARNSRPARLYLPLFILLALYTGGRKGAVLGLRWPQVDLERARIDFNPLGRAQNSKRRPIIPIPRRLVTFLKLARRRGGDLGYVINLDGKPIADIKGSFTAACRRAGLDDVTPHTLRHTAGTLMAQSGVPLFEIAGYLGHSGERTTELYSHHCDDFLERARQAFD